VTTPGVTKQAIQKAGEKVKTAASTFESECP
jgi:hypothetical protein